MYQQPPACSDRLNSALNASDLLAHHFSLYCGLEGKSEGHTHDQLCVCMSPCPCVFILKCQFGMVMLYQPCSLGAECP